MTRVLLVDDHDVFRHGLAQLLGDEGLEVIGQASGGAAGARLARELAPDVVLMDLAMPGMDGIEAARQIKAERYDLPVIAYTAKPALDHHRALFTALCLKPCPPDAVVAAVKDVLARAG